MSERRVALITGSSRGIGLATAKQFLAEGYDLALTDCVEDRLQAAAEELRAIDRSCNVFAARADLAEMDQAESIVQQTAGHFGRIDVLVNNAAWREMVSMDRISCESWERTLRICVTAPAFLARWSAPHMKPNGGVIVNMSSVTARRTAGIAAAYVAAKGAIESLTYELAVLYGPIGIRVVAIAPGAIDTEMSRDLTAAEQVDTAAELRKYSEGVIPLARWGEAEEIARTIAWLASDKASYISGTTITVDGGWQTSQLPQSLRKKLMEKK